MSEAAGKLWDQFPSSGQCAPSPPGGTAGVLTLGAWLPSFPDFIAFYFYCLLLD